MKDYSPHKTNDDKKKKRKQERNKILWGIALLIFFCGVFGVVNLVLDVNENIFCTGAFLFFVSLVSALLLAIKNYSFPSLTSPEDFRVFSELVPLFREHLLPFGYQEKFSGSIFKTLQYTRAGSSVELSVDMRERYYIFSISDSGIHQIMPDKRADENIYNLTAYAQDEESEKKFVAKVKENFDLWQGISPKE